MIKSNVSSNWNWKLDQHTEQSIQQTKVAVRHEVETAYGIWLAFLQTTGNKQDLHPCDSNINSDWNEEFHPMFSEVTSLKGSKVTKVTTEFYGMIWMIESQMAKAWISKTF